MNEEVKRILIVDDSPVDVELTIAALAEKSLADEIIHAEDGEEALDYLYKRGKFITEKGNPAVILLDIKMPGMGGMEVLKTIRSDDDFKLIPVIMLTSSHDAKDMLESYKNGASSYVVKPLHIVQFVEAVKMMRQYGLMFVNKPSVSPIN